MGRERVSLKGVGLSEEKDVEDPDLKRQRKHALCVGWSFLFSLGVCVVVGSAGPLGKNRPQGLALTEAGWVQGRGTGRDQE